jgi:hypothetical protein
VNPALFLVARLKWPSEAAGFRWVVADGEPFEPVDPLDFATGPEAKALFGLYQDAYTVLDPELNVTQPAELVEYNRWLLVEDPAGAVVAFVCFKTTAWGMKLGLVATDGSPAAKSAVKTILLGVLIEDGVYAEVSNGVERALRGHVAEVGVSVVRELLVGKRIEPEADGLHYRRMISNVGFRTKLMVGKPLLLK